MSEPRSGPRPADQESPAPEPAGRTPEQTPAAGPVPVGPHPGPTSAGAPAPATGPAYGTPPEAAAPGSGTPGYGTPPADGTPGHGPGRVPAPLAPGDERTWAMAAHLSGFVAAYVALGFLGPLVVLLVAGNRSAYVRRHAVEALNFNLSVLIYVLICVPLVFVLIGIPMLLAVGLLYLVTTIQGTIAASRGQEFRYPLSIRFVS